MDRNRLRGGCSDLFPGHFIPGQRLSERGMNNEKRHGKGCAVLRFRAGPDLIFK